MKILFGMLGLEANTFASDIGDFDRWAPNGWPLGEEVFRVYRNTPRYPGGMIAAAEEEGVELIPSVALLSAAPPATKEALDYAIDTLISYVKKYHGQYDGICLGLHGAGVADGVDDLELYTLQKVREVVGNEMPITSSFDLHGNISEEMVALSNGVFGIKEYPHTDTYETGFLAMKTLIRILRGECKPETAIRRLPLFTAPGFSSTLREPMRRFKEYVAQYAKAHHLIDATFFHGFAYTDVPCAGASVVVVAVQGAQKAADEIAQWIWEHRAELVPKCLMPDEAVDLALEKLKDFDDGFVLINESSDNPGGGTPGDGTYLLREFLERDLDGAIFSYIPDREMVEKALCAGIGGHISGMLGGHTDNMHGAPIYIEDAEVLSLSNGKARYVSPVVRGLQVSYGKTARVRVGKVEIIITERLNEQTFDDRPFVISGADLAEYRIVGIKSSAHFRGFFQPIAKAIVTTDPPGIQTSNLSQLTYHRIQRPVYPLDVDTTFDLTK